MTKRNLYHTESHKVNAFELAPYRRQSIFFIESLEMEFQLGKSADRDNICKLNYEFKCDFLAKVSFDLPEKQRTSSFMFTSGTQFTPTMGPV